MKRGVVHGAFRGGSQSLGPYWKLLRMHSAHASQHGNASGAPPQKYHLLLFAKPAIRAGAFPTPDAALNVIKCIELGKKITDSVVFNRNALFQY
jgi:hypothetical protein